ncbi:MAG TPA: type VI secretion system baseplate subunit TssE [Polyangiales bacterium]|nr:type VI secretion system baseplate subunit TssE [Polyangiales bacterium]
MSDRGLLSRLGAGQRSADTLASIAAHLRELLNARQGLSESVGSYGIVDFNDVVHTLPDGVRTLQHSIRAAILEHEPRLNSVAVRAIPGEDALSLRFEITGRLASDRRTVVRLHTEMRCGGLFVVE